MKVINPKKPELSSQLLSVVAGIALIAVGIFLMIDFLLKFLKFGVGLVLFFIGWYFLARR
jgi:preprotein translocase subunit SecE